jgi:L-arabinose isomerase
MADIEMAIIDAQTDLRGFQQQLRNNEVYYALRKGWTI